MSTSPRLSETRICHYLKLAKQSCSYSDFTKARLGSVLVYKGQVMSVGWNSNKTNPLQKSLNKLRGFDPEASSAHNSLHAETACLIKARDLDIDWAKASLFVYRIKKDGSSGLSRPCPGCMSYIRSMGIKDIYYSTDNGWCYEKVDN